MAKSMIVSSCLLGMASAFMPSTPLASNVQSSSSEMKMGFESELGVTAPLGFWDPLGFTKDIDQKKFDFYRAAEIKHGRIAQLAFLGYVVPHFGRLPGLLSSSENVAFADIPNGHAAISSVPLYGWAQIILFQSVMETVVWPQKKDKAPGDIQPVGGWVRYSDPEVKKNKLNKELNNGRAAMMAIMGLIAQELVTGKSPIETYLGQ